MEGEQRTKETISSFQFEQQNEGRFDGRIGDHECKCMLTKHIIANIYFNKKIISICFLQFQILKSFMEL